MIGDLRCFVHKDSLLFLQPQVQTTLKTILKDFYSRSWFTLERLSIFFPYTLRNQKFCAFFSQNHNILSTLFQKKLISQVLSQNRNIIWIFFHKKHQIEKMVFSDIRIRLRTKKFSSFERT